MIITEAEAKTKWCCGGPMQFLAASQLHSGDKVLPDEGKCVGSACMAWQWVGGKDDGGGRGYCGLAGQRP